jgi:hypothetical protein
MKRNFGDGKRVRIRAQWSAGVAPASAMDSAKSQALMPEAMRDISDEYYEGNMLKRFLEEILPTKVAEVYSRGLVQQIDLNGNYQNVAVRLKDEKLKVRLCQIYREKNGFAGWD